MLSCAENLMKWQCGGPTESNENIVFWMNWNEVCFHRMWVGAAFPAVLCRQWLGIFFMLAWQRFLCCGWILRCWIFIFIFILLLFSSLHLPRAVWPSMLGCFSEMPCFIHIPSHTFTPLGASVTPLLLTECLPFASRVLIVSLRVTSASCLGMRPACSVAASSRFRLSDLKKQLSLSHS